MKIRFEKEEVYSFYFKSENLHDAEVELSETELSFYHSSMLYFRNPNFGVYCWRMSMRGVYHAAAKVRLPHSATLHLLPFAC